MLNSFYERHLFIWIFLIALTLVTLGVSQYSGHLLNLEPEALLLLAAFIKIRLVLWSFMEVKDSPWALRLFCDTWILSSYLGCLYFLIF